MTPPDPATPSPLEALLKEVEALDREATPGPWTFDNGSIRGVLEEGPHADHVVPGFAFAKRTRIVASMHGPGNDGAVTKYRTAAPRLAAIVRVLMDSMDAISQADVMFSEPMSAAVAKLALRRADEIAGGGA